MSITVYAYECQWSATATADDNAATPFHWHTWCNGKIKILLVIRPVRPMGVVVHTWNGKINFITTHDFLKHTNETN